MTELVETTEVLTLNLYPENKPLPQCGLMVTVTLQRGACAWVVDCVIECDRVKGKTLAEIGPALQRAVYTAAQGVLTYAERDTDGWKEPIGN